MIKGFYNFTCGSNSWEGFSFLSVKPSYQIYRFLFSHTTILWYIHGVVLSSIGNSTLHDPQIRGDFMLLTVILRLLKSVRTLTKILLCKKASSNSRRLQEDEFFRFFKKPGPDARRVRRLFQGKKTLLLEPPTILLTEINSTRQKRKNRKIDPVFFQVAIRIHPGHLPSKVRICHEFHCTGLLF